MTREPQWIDKAMVLAIHERLLAEHGGPIGVLDEAGLESALASPRNHFAYGGRDLFELAASYAFAITKDHPFTDGNKRVALTLAGVFLELNGFRLQAPERDAVEAMLALSTGELDPAGYANWLKDSSMPTPATGAPRSTARVD